MGRAIEKSKFCHVYAPYVVEVQTRIPSAVIMRNVFGEDPNSKKTTFFEIRPYQLPIMGFVGGEPMIEKNSNKPKLESNELDNLNNYLRSKGLDI